MSASGMRDRLLQKVMESLGLDNHPELNKTGSASLSSALHEEDSRPLVLWATLRPFLAAYVKEFPEATGLWDRDVSDATIMESINEVLDQGHFYLTQHLIKVHLRGEKPLSLSGMANLRYDRKTQFSSWERYRQTLAREIFPHAEALQLWKIQVLTRPNVNGGGSISGYKVTAGQALIDFDKYVFQPKRLQLHRRFVSRFPEELSPARPRRSK